MLASRAYVAGRACLASQCRQLSTVASDGLLGMDKYFTPLLPGGEPKDKESFTEYFETCKAAVMGKPVKSLGGKGLAEADIKSLNLAEKFVARRLRLQALKYRDYLTEAGMLKDFESLTAGSAWDAHQKSAGGMTASFVEAFKAGKAGADSPAYAALPEWSKATLDAIKQDAAEVKAFASKNGDAAKAVEAAVAQAKASRAAGGVMPTCAEAKHPSTCVYTVEGTPEYDFQYHFAKRLDLLARTPDIEYVLTAEDKALCAAENAVLRDKYGQVLGSDEAIPVPDKISYKP